MTTEEGKVLSWGHGGHGQLGNSLLRNQKIPTEVEALADKKIVFIACGGSTSAAITGKIKLWLRFDLRNHSKTKNMGMVFDRWR